MQNKHITILETPLLTHTHPITRTLNLNPYRDAYDILVRMSVAPPPPAAIPDPAVPPLYPPPPVPHPFVKPPIWPTKTYNV